MIRLHHGSNVGIDAIDLSLSKRAKISVKDFISTPVTNKLLKWLSLKWTSSEWEFHSFHRLTLMKMQLVKQVLSIKVFDDYSKEWAQFVVDNRNNNSDYPIHDFDIVIGPIADDKVGFQIRKYIENEISIDKLIERIKYYGDKSTQYFFGTEKSLNYLSKVL